MRRPSTAELLQIRELLQMETNAVALAKATTVLIQDDELKVLAQAGVQTSEARIKGMQQLINENNIITEGVH